MELADKYRITGQVRGLRKILFWMESIEKEQQLVDLGITTFIYKENFFVKKQSNNTDNIWVNLENAK